MVDELEELDKVEKSPDGPNLQLTVAQKLGILPKFVDVVKLYDNRFRVTILEYKEVLWRNRLMYKDSYFVIWSDGEIVYSNPEIK